MTRDLTSDLELLRRLVEQTGRVGRASFRAFTDVTNKADEGFDPVTEVDQSIEALVRGALLRERPDDTIIGEEDEDQTGSSDWTWVIDPIDGTRAFIAGLPTWCTLIALVHEGEPVLSAIAQPFTREVFYGVCAKGERQAWLDLAGDVQTITTRSDVSLSNAVMTSTDPDLFKGEEHRVFTEIKDRARLTRYGLDAYGYAALALGGVDLVVESGLKVWDIAALVPVVVGAGGVLTNWSGGSALSTGQVLASAQEPLHEEALNLLKPAAYPSGS